MKTFVEYCKAVGSLAFGLMIGIGAVMIAVPDYQEKLPSMFAQTVDQGDISVSLLYDESNPPLLFTGSSIRYNLEIANTSVQGVGEEYPNVEVRIILSDGLEYDAISQDVVTLNTPPTVEGNTYTFTYRDPLPAGEIHTFRFDLNILDTGEQTVTVEVNHPATDNESIPYISGCPGPTNNTACDTVTVSDNIQPTCNPSLASLSIYEDGQVNDDTFRNLDACEQGNFGNPFPNPGDSAAAENIFTYDCILTGKTPVSCSIQRRFCGDLTIDADQGEACDTDPVNGLECDQFTCQIIGCTDPLAYNPDPSATQDNGECRVMGDGIIDFTDGEVCDDGNIISGDGCSDVGEIESGYDCPVGGQPCIDIDECQQAICGSNSLCENTLGSFTCSCEVGYESDDGANCVDIDECSIGTDSCDSNASCSNTNGSFSCACEAGYEGSGETCTDIDECVLGIDLCDDNGVCSNTAGGYDCSCSAGFYNQMNSQGSGPVNTCLEIDECTGQVDDQNGGYTTIPESNDFSQGETCTSLGGICSNELGGTPGFSCDCPNGFHADGQGVCQVVFGDGITIAGREECDTGSLGIDDGCDDQGQYEVPSCQIAVSPTTGTIGSIHDLSLEQSLAPWASIVLVERGDGTVEENPLLPESHAYSAGQQFTITATIENTLNPSILGTCETIVAIDTVCGNEIQEAGEACDGGAQNGIMCSTGYDQTCEYCSSSCTLLTVSGSTCGDGIVDQEFEACDAGDNNNQVCTGTPGSLCEYCSSSCELVEYAIPLKTRSGSASSVRVSVKTTDSGITTEKTHTSAGSEDISKTVSDQEDSMFVSDIVKSLIPDNTTAQSKGITLSPVSLDEIFMQPVTTLTPESLSEILYTITHSSKEQIRASLQKYLDMKEAMK